MKVSSAKAKGRTGQNEIKELFLKNGFEEHELKTAIMGESGDDLQVFRKDWKWSVEVKRQEKLSIWAAMKQAAARGNPMVFFRRNREKWYVCLEAEEFMKRFGKEL